MTTETAILQTQTVAVSAPGWSVPLSFNQFDPSLGTLSDVDVGIVGDVTGTAAIQNLGATAASLQINLPSVIDVAAADGTWLASVSPEATATVNLGAYNGTTDFTGSSGTVVAGFSNVATAVSDYIPGTGTAVTAVGTGSMDLTASSQVSSSQSADGNLLSLIQGEAGATVSVQYVYQPPDSWRSGSVFTSSVDVGSEDVSITGGFYYNYYGDVAPVVIRTTAPQTLAVSDRTTDWNTVVTANQFNPAFGSLLSVNLTVVGDINAGLAVENLGSTSSSIGLTETADITLTLPGGLGVATAAPSINSTTDLAAFDGTIDFAGPSGENLTGLTASESTTLDESGYLPAFIGTGTIGLPISAISPSILTGPADLASELLTEAGATVTISYTYAVPNDSGSSSIRIFTYIPGATASIISGTEGDQAVTNQATVTPFSGVAITDPNTGLNESVTVTLSAAANGTLTNLGGGSYDAATGVYTDSGSAAAVTAALDGLVFNPTPGLVAPGQTVTTGFTITDANTSGIAATDTTTSVIVTTGTAALTISGTEAGQGVTDQTTVAPFANVLIDDPNAAQTETVTIRQSAAAHGTLSDLGGGRYNAITGVYTDTGSAAAVTSALDGLVFTPAAVAPGQTTTTGFTITDTDTVGLTVTDATTSVAATAGVFINTASAAAAIEAELHALAVPPTITGTVAGQAVTDHTSIAPFASVVITDPNVIHADTVTVMLSNAANGTLTNLGGGSYNAMMGVYTDSGSAAAVTAALNGLLFTPKAGQVALGRTVTTDFTIADTDTVGASATNRVSSVIATATDRAPGWQNTPLTKDKLGIAATGPTSFIHFGSSVTPALSVGNLSETTDVFSVGVKQQSSDNATISFITSNDFALDVDNNTGSGADLAAGFSATAPRHQGGSLIMSQLDGTGVINSHPTGS
jgi:hypothetical protein